MNSGELKLILAEFDLSQSDFSKLVDVTPRAVTLWISGTRAVPGPARGLSPGVQAPSSQSAAGGAEPAERARDGYARGYV